MFGFQRIGDLCWAAGDQQARGFLIGGTSGRTTLNGEGLQHEDGHSHIQSLTIPNCISYDPAYAYEVAVIMHDGLVRMYGEAQENVYYYITTLNENYHMPAMPEGAEEGIRKGIYKLETIEGSKGKVQLLGSGSILRHVREAAQIWRKTTAWVPTCIALPPSPNWRVMAGLRTLEHAAPAGNPARAVYRSGNERRSGSGIH